MDCCSSPQRRCPPRGDRPPPANRTMSASHHRSHRAATPGTNDRPKKSVAHPIQLSIFDHRPPPSPAVAPPPQRKHHQGQRFAFYPRPPRRDAQPVDSLRSLAAHPGRWMCRRSNSDLSTIAGRPGPHHGVASVSPASRALNVKPGQHAATNHDRLPSVEQESHVTWCPSPPW
jgi:hypothetical protein